MLCLCVVALQCSIDALLERTIKHMLFLQSVTKHADKLKQTGESKVHAIYYPLFTYVKYYQYFTAGRFSF